MSEFKPVFKSSKFLYLWASQMLSQMTVNIVNFILLAHIYTVTNSSIATSLLWVSYSLPALLIGPIGSASVDLVSRRKLLMLSNLLQSITVFLYIFVGMKSIFYLYAIVFAYSVLNQFYGPAEAASLPSTVGKKLLPRANSIFFMTQQISMVLGFGFAGILQGILGFNGAIILCTVFLFLAFVSVSFLSDDKPKKKLSGEFEKVLKTLFNSIIEGYDFIRENKAILFPLLILLGIQAALAIVIVSLPVIATEILNIPVGYSGLSIALPAGIGALLGSVYIPKLIKKTIRKKALIEASLGLTTFSLFVLSIGIPFLPVWLRISITPILIMATGFAFVGINIPALTFLQESTPEWFRGRVFGSLWFMTTLISIIPVIFSGAISEIFGVRTLFAMMATGTFLVMLYSKRRGQKMIETHL